jgi:hypothetical protein
MRSRHASVNSRTAALGVRRRFDTGAVLGAPANREEGQRRARFGLLLGAITATVAVQGTFHQTDLKEAVVSFLLGGTLLLAFWSADMQARRLRRAAIIVAVVVAGVIVALLAGNGDRVVGAVAIANGLLILLAPPAIVVGVLRSLRKHGQVTIEVVMGSLCLYMLAGMFFAFAYGAIENLGGTPFFAGGDDWTPQRAVYFSFTTLTTTGYGDLTARSDVGHMLSVTEALFGQIYLVTVVAVIVSNLIPSRLSRR